MWFRSNFPFFCSDKTMHIIIRKELKLFPYKIMKTPKLKPFDAERRVAFCNKMKQILSQDSAFHQRIFYSDESSVFLNGYVNRQNTRRYVYWKVIWLIYFYLDMKHNDRMISFWSQKLIQRMLMFGVACTMNTEFLDHFSLKYLMENISSMIILILKTTCSC